MFQLEHVEITGFWGKYHAVVDLQPDVNIIIGRNGSGKTTFVNLLQAVLKVDLRALSAGEYQTITLRLRHGRRTRTVSATRESSKSGDDCIRYKVGPRTWVLPLFPPDVNILRRYRLNPRSNQEYQELSGHMQALVKLSSLSVHRTASEALAEDEYSPRQRRLERPGIDQRLEDLLRQLTNHQLTLAQESSQISAEFQKRVLVSMLYDVSFDTFASREIGRLEVNKEKEDLARAYEELGALDAGTSKRIDKHFEVLQKSIDKVQSQEKGLNVNDIVPLPLLRRTQHIIKLSLDAEKEKQKVFLQVRQFTKILGDFMGDKEIQLSQNGALSIRKDGREIPALDLSSGEKQLLILMTETLLQKQEPFVFIADEPELSLHVAWQEQVISSIIELNARAQVIVATHSPEIAAGRENKLLDMGDLIHG